jgi:hypothetical protein
MSDGKMSAVKGCSVMAGSAISSYSGGLFAESPYRGLYSIESVGLVNGVILFGIGSSRQAI